MIHMHNTLSSAVDPSASGINSRPPVSADTLASFRNALSDAVSSTFERFGIDPNQVQVSITPTNASNTPAASATNWTSGTTPSTSSTAPSTSDPSQTNSDYDPFLQAAHNDWVGVAVPSPSSSANVGSAATAAVDPQTAFDNDYWAQQPAAVQALRTMQDPEQRDAYAHQLASEGYTIDVPIMVWGWDPSLVTSMRQADGYTWVPSAMQNPVPVAPGLGALGNLPAYDPNSPPPGSIMV